jgi:hypothetical protein
MRKSKIEQVAEARRGVRAVVREGERTRMLCVVIVPRRWESVNPAQPVPRMAIVSFLLLLEEVLWLRVVGPIFKTGGEMRFEWGMV